MENKFNRYTFMLLATDVFFDILLFRQRFKSRAVVYQKYSSINYDYRASNSI